MGRRKPDALFWIMAFLSSVCLVVITWLDVGCFFEIGTPMRWLVAGGYLEFVWPLLLSLRGRVVVGVALVWMLAILPQVRWNHFKSFYVDARRLERGMEEAEVREIMAPYLEVGRTYQPTAHEQESWEPRHPSEGMLFIHSVLGWTDHCEVRLDSRGRVRSIHIEKD